MREADGTKVLGWPGYRVYQHEINEKGKTLKLWVRRKHGNQKLVCSGCGGKVAHAYDSYEREVRDLPCFEFLTTVVELYRVRCPNCGSRRHAVLRVVGSKRWSVAHFLRTIQYPFEYAGRFLAA
jgi:transposase